MTNEKWLRQTEVANYFDALEDAQHHILSIIGYKEFDKLENIEWVSERLDDNKQGILKSINELKELSITDEWDESEINAIPEVWEVVEYNLTLKEYLKRY